MSLSLPKILPLAQQIGGYLKMAADHYVVLHNIGKEASAEVVAAFLQVKMADWDPKISGKTLLDDDTREAAARFLAGVAVNYAKAER